MKKFQIKCNQCGGDKVIVDGFIKESMLTISRTAAHPLLYCLDCENEWNPFILDVLDNNEEQND